MSRHTWETETPWPEPMSAEEAAKALTAWESRRQAEMVGRDLPPEPGDEAVEKCPYCGGEWFEGVGFGADGPERCYQCGHMSHESER